MDWLSGVEKDFQLRTGESLRHHTSMQVGGEADYFYEPENITELSLFLQQLKRHRAPFYLLGGGTNTVFSDKGFQGVVIKFNRMNAINLLESGDLDQGNTLYVGAGFATQKLLKYCMAKGLAGVEFLAGVPGTVGGAFCMNAGAMGGSMSDIVSKVRVCRLSGEVVELEKSEMAFGYRTCRYGGGAVVGVYLHLPGGDPDEIAEMVRLNLESRKSRQPGGRTFGSVFRNPPGRYAAEMIDKLGLKGFSIGGAGISGHHANFIVNKGGATSRDIRKLIWHAGKRVSLEYGIDMMLEVRLVGR